MTPRQHLDVLAAASLGRFPSLCLANALAHTSDAPGSVDLARFKLESCALLVRGRWKSASCSCISSLFPSLSTELPSLPSPEKQANRLPQPKKVRASALLTNNDCALCEFLFSRLSATHLST
eukprot:2316666-Rhodomonas_salina.2